MGGTGHGIVLQWREQDNRLYDERNRTRDDSMMERNRTRDSVMEVTGQEILNGTRDSMMEVTGQGMVL